MALDTCHLEFFAVLITLQVDLVQGEKRFQRNALFNAIFNDNLEIMNAILDGGTDIDSLHEGKSTVYVAATNRATKCLKSLLDRNASVNLKYNGKFLTKSFTVNTDAFSAKQNKT